MMVDGALFKGRGIYLGERQTNNVAEYQGVIRGLRWAHSVRNRDAETKITLHLDSELIERQLRGVYQVKNEDLRILYDEARELIDEMSVRVEHVLRQYNKLADSVCTRAIVLQKDVAFDVLDLIQRGSFDDDDDEKPKSKRPRSTGDESSAVL